MLRDLTAMFQEISETITKLDILLSRVKTHVDIPLKNIFLDIKNRTYSYYRTLESILTNNIYEFECRLIRRLLIETKNKVVKVNTTAFYERSNVELAYIHNRPHVIEIITDMRNNLDGAEIRIDQVLEICTIRKEKL